MGAGASRSSKVEKIGGGKPPTAPRSSSAATSKTSFFSRGSKARPESGPPANRTSSAKSSDSGFQSTDLQGSPESTISGPGLPTEGGKVPLGGRRPDQSRQEARKVLDSLRSEGLIDETAEGKAGVCYEVPLGELQPAKRRPPARLAKLQRQNDMQLSRQRIGEKLEKAERRRKRREQEKIERSREKDSRNLEVKLALFEIERNREKELSRQVNLNVSSHLQRRADRVDQIIKKQKAHELKVTEVQNRKLLSPRPFAPDPSELAMMTPKLSPRNIDDMLIPTLARGKKR